MIARTRSTLAVGLLLVVAGILLLVFQVVPGLRTWARAVLDWPLIVVGVGAFLFIFGLLVGAPGMAVPASIVAGIGGILMWQNATGAWESWAYAWTLIPGFVGVGIVLEGLFSGRARKAISDGGWMVLISLTLFLVFGSFLGGPVALGGYWPALLIVLGVLFLFRSLFSFRK
jgi:cation transport ATPase